ncbi:MAG: hypothetical protein ACLP5V_06255 [Candidatus Bathyarchaeia archaeon]
MVRETLRQYGSFLPATLDEPAEEPQPPDPDQTDDDSNFELRNLCESIEDLASYDRPYVPVGDALHRDEDNFFKLFLDGSLRSYYLGEQIEDSRSYPLVATEVAAAVIKRDDTGKASVLKFRKKIALLVPPMHQERTLSDLYGLKQKLGNSEFTLDVIPLKKEECKSGVDLRQSLIDKAKSVMRDVEHDLAEDPDLGRNHEEWLVLDGAIRSRGFLKMRETIGLAKSFSRKPIFRFPGQGTKDVAALMSGLREGERTAVFKHAHEPETSATRGHEPLTRDVAFWYLRLRSGKGLEGPLQGIVKVDMFFPGARLGGVECELVDRISRALLAEKYVSPYPTPRWHAHIYPIYVAENFIKSRLLSPLAFRGSFGGV